MDGRTALVCAWCTALWIVLAMPASSMGEGPIAPAAIDVGDWGPVAREVRVEKDDGVAMESLLRVTKPRLRQVLRAASVRHVLFRVPPGLAMSEALCRLRES